MDKHHLLIMAASNIAGGIAATNYSKAIGAPGLSSDVITNIAQLSITIAHRIAEEATKHPLK